MWAFTEIGQFLYHLQVPRYSRVVASFFQLRLLKSHKKFRSQRCTNIHQILSKNSAPQRKIRCLKLLGTLRISSKQTELRKGMHLYLFLEFEKISGGDGVKPPSPTRALRPYITTIDSHFLCSRYRNFLCISRLFHIHYRMKEDIWAIVLVLDIKIKILKKYISNNSH